MNPDSRKTLEDLLRSLTELAAASAAVKRACQEWLDANRHAAELLTEQTQAAPPSTHKLRPAGTQILDAVATSYQAVALPNDTDDDPHVN